MRNQVNSMPQSSAPAAVEVNTLQVEAARYAVIRRLAPCLHHHMVRPLQPIGLIYGVMQHKLGIAAPDLKSVREEADKINEFAKAALDECSDISSWLAPEPGVAVRADEAVRECVGLLATMLHFCGFRLSNEIDELSVAVNQSAVRMVLSAALLEMTDSMGQQAPLRISADASEEEVTITLEFGPGQDNRANRYDENYRKLVWDDVQALASAEQVGLSRQDRRVVLRFPVAVRTLTPALSSMMH